jgi:hypothetical protein
MADRKHGKVDLPCGLTHGSKNDCAKVTFQISDDPLVTRGDSHARLCLVLQQVLLGVQLREQVLRRHPMEGCNHATLDLPAGYLVMPARCA